MKRPVPVTLEGRRVRLEPLSIDHAEQLAAAAATDPGTFRFMSASPLEIGAAEYVRAALQPEFVSFAVVDRDAGVAIGSTRFGDIAVEHRRLEIGWTWLDVRHRGTDANPEMKLLMLHHAFDELGCERVALKTDGRNERSQRAIAGIGAVREGVLRRHMVARDGRPRDTVYFSVLRDEWPGVRARLQARLSAR